MAKLTKLQCSQKGHEKAALNCMKNKNTYWKAFYHHEVYNIQDKQKRILTENEKRRIYQKRLPLRLRK